MLASISMDIINSGLETEQPIRVHFYDLTLWTWCLAPPLQFPHTRSSIEIRYIVTFWVSENCIFFLVDLVYAAATCRLDRISSVYRVSNPWYNISSIGSILADNYLGS